MPDVGIVAALPKEAATWQVAQHTGDGFQLATAGVGGQRAAQAARELVAAGAQALLSWGVAGGLSKTLRPGDLVLADRVACVDGEETPDPAWCGQLALAMTQAGLSVSRGGLWSSAATVTSVADKHQLAARGWVAVDMESAAVARVARSAGIPFAAIRSISDPAERALPEQAAGLLRADGGINVVALIAILLRGPGMWRALRVMQDDFAAACASLQLAAEAVQLSCRP